jgi:orotidine-5'-phosphate decarboxylase
MPYDGNRGEKTGKEALMSRAKTIEMFSAGCPLCQKAEEMARRAAQAGWEVVVQSMHSLEGAARARELGVAVVPSVAVNGRLLDCCSQHGPSQESLRAAARAG